MYVIEKHAERNELVVGAENELGKSQMVAGEVNWINTGVLSQIHQSTSWIVDVKIRYKARPVQASLSLLPDERVRVQFNHPLRDVTPGQRAVFYRDEECLGGGTILAL
jgi:tRNA-specific 2-thiouridylase